MPGLSFTSRASKAAPIKGLTSAAALWLTASLGTAAGCGLWQMTLAGTVMTLVILSGFKRVKNARVYKKVVRRKRFRTPPLVKMGTDQTAPP